jgi:hypothetical protein
LAACIGTFATRRALGTGRIVCGSAGTFGARLARSVFTTHLRTLGPVHAAGAAFTLRPFLLSLVLFLGEGLHRSCKRAGDGGDGGESHQEAFHGLWFLHAGSPAA